MSLCSVFLLLNEGCSQLDPPDTPASAGRGLQSAACIGGWEVGWKVSTPLGPAETMGHGRVLLVFGSGLENIIQEVFFWQPLC